VPASVNRGVPIVMDEPKHPVSVALRAFADQYILNVAPQVPADPETDEVPPTRRSTFAQKRERHLFHRGART